MNTAFILAGGLGTRLRPLTYAVPKPLLPVGEKPILEIIIENLKKININNIYISVNYKKELIKSYFGDGENFGVNISYIDEKVKAGTAGSLNLIQGLIDETFLIMNGDLLTDINFNDMLQFHRDKKSKFTIAVRDYSINVPYGVLNTDTNFNLINFIEKPVVNYLINTGIYICESEVIELVNHNEFLDMPELWKRINDKYCKNIFLYKFDEKWIDIGQIEDYLKLQNN